MVRGNWVASFKDTAGQQVDRLTTGLVDQVTVLEARNAEALQEIVSQFDNYSTKIEGYLRQMGLSL